jgi:hypothetical protein
MTIDVNIKYEPTTKGARDLVSKVLETLWYFSCDKTS